MTTDLARPLRAICLALPEVTERPSHGAPTFFVQDKKSFVTLWASGHHDDDFPHRWCAGLNWAGIAELCQDAYRAVAPARLVTLLDAG